MVAGHTACAGCHADDFGARWPKKCGACHNATEPWRALIADRPLPERTEFGATLDHEQAPRRLHHVPRAAHRRPRSCARRAAMPRA